MSSPSGIWAAILRGLASPWATWIAGVVLGALGILGAGAGFGQHPAEGALAQVATALLVFAACAALLRQRDLPAAFWALGVVCVGVGAILAGGEAGELRLRAGEIETYEQVVNGRGATTHLGGRLALVDGRILRLVVKETVIGEAEVPAPGREAVVGPWRIHRRAVAAGVEPTHARLTITPREGGDPIAHRLREGQSVTVSEGVQLTVKRLVGDYGKALGPAALIDITAKDETITAWHFAEAPDLDQAVGTAPAIVTLQGVDAAPALVLGVRRTGAGGPMAIGFGIMACGMLFGAARRRS